jgi:hypothetical protein
MPQFLLCKGRLSVEIGGTASRTLFETIDGVTARFYVDTPDARLVLTGLPLRLRCHEGELEIVRMNGDVLFEFVHQDGRPVRNTCLRAFFAEALATIEATPGPEA